MTPHPFRLDGLHQTGAAKLALTTGAVFVRDSDDA
jgi:hypothetical protein